MLKIIKSPAQYVQGENLIGNLGEYYSQLGSKGAYVLADPFVAEHYGDVIKSGFSNYHVDFAVFGGESSEGEVQKHVDALHNGVADVILGIGGGKTLDTAKAVAHYAGIPVIIVPTIASADAPCTALSVLYTEDGAFDKYLFLKTNPNIVIMDTDVIAKAPVRLFVAGMGDALATYFEAQTCVDSCADSLVAGKVAKGALALAQLCLQTLLEDGLKAKLALEQGVCTEAVENIIEANTYLSGVGAESGGLAAAHAVHNGFTVLEECHHLFHGEKVAFGTLVQLVLENKPLAEIEEIVAFCTAVGLPTTLADMGAGEVSQERLMDVAKAATAEGETIHNSVKPVTAKDVYAAILGADAIGRALK